jgi:predicted HNH restriction endonuclease
MIPKGFQRQIFLEAIAEIDQNGVPKLRKSHRYNLLLNGKKYPPKYVISIACKHLNGAEWPSNKFNAVEAKNYFINNGYKVLDGKSNRKNIPIFVSEDEESKYPEGAEKYKYHRSLERDPSIARKAKERRFNLTGELKCDVCGFSFFGTYGVLGEGFIEAHHTIPVTELRGNRKITIKEIALVCSNCHRMLHMGDKCLSVEYLKRIIEERKSTTVT